MGHDPGDDRDEDPKVVGYPDATDTGRQYPYCVTSGPKADGTYPVGKLGGHVLCFAPTLVKARHVAYALNCYFEMGFDYVAPA